MPPSAWTMPANAWPLLYTLPAALACLWWWGVLPRAVAVLVAAAVAGAAALVAPPWAGAAPTGPIALAWVAHGVAVGLLAGLPLRAVRMAGDWLAAGYDQPASRGALDLAALGLFVALGGPADLVVALASPPTWLATPSLGQIVVDQVSTAVALMAPLGIATGALVIAVAIAQRAVGAQVDGARWLRPIATLVLALAIAHVVIAATALGRAGAWAHIDGGAPPGG